MLNIDDVRTVLVGVAETPALVFSRAELEATAQRVKSIAAESGCTPLYAMKPCSLFWVLRTLAPYVAGFGASSPFEARLARQVLGANGNIHYYAVAIADAEIEEVSRLADYVSFNSIRQLSRYRDIVSAHASPGLRVNPGISFVGDERYDPCRRHSKLGAPMSDVVRLEQDTGAISRGSRGLHLHTNCDSDDFHDLRTTVLSIQESMGGLIDTLDWVNLGGGYLFSETCDAEALSETCAMLRRGRDLEIFIEPGAAFVRDAGYVVSTVLDVFDSDGVEVAVLDTTVNHMPEVFEYQYEPEVLEHVPEGPHRYLLAGRSCLSGDVFGDYRFDEPLEPGSRLTFSGMGAYTQAKSHTFNGINLPTVYALDNSGDLSPVSTLGFEHFAARNGAQEFAFS
jgi:carboxynorspermidine decarboxylase